MSAIAEPLNKNLREAIKDLGLGHAPDAYGDNCEAQIADECNTSAKIIVVETADYTSELPLRDVDVNATYNNVFSPWQTQNNNPPPGVLANTNTLITAGMPNSNMIIRGLELACRVEPEGRTIRGNFFDPTGALSLPMSPDVFTRNDIANNALGFAQGQDAETMLPCELLYGLATWKAALFWSLAYNFVWKKNNQESLLKDPLYAVGKVKPFSEAMAAGTALGSNIDRILAQNQRLAAVGQSKIMMPITHKRLGGLTIAGPLNVGNFTPSREDDASPTVFGGVGLPENTLTKEPYIFSTPVFWPLGQPMGMTFEVNNPVFLAEFQRWMTLTGNVSGGQDLNLPFNPIPGMSAIAPTTLTAGVTALEQTLDPTPVNTGQQVNTNRALLKGGKIVFSIGIIGRRVPQPWNPHVLKAIKEGAIQAPMGWGTLNSAA